MDELKNESLSALVDMLSKHTDRYLDMLKEGTTEKEFRECKMMMSRLISEIESRKHSTTQRISFEEKKTHQGLP